jgi:hypothetical protein
MLTTDFGSFLFQWSKEIKFYRILNNYLFNDENISKEDIAFLKRTMYIVKCRKGVKKLIKRLK